MRTPAHKLVMMVVLILMMAQLQAYADTSLMSDVLKNSVENFEVRETPLEDVLRLLANQNDLNLIIGPDTMETISFRFANVSLESALDAILRAKGYKYDIYDNILLVTQPDSLEITRGLGRETRLFKLKYANARDVRAIIDTSGVLSPWGRTSVAYKSMNTDVVRAYGIKPGLDFIEGKIIDLYDPLKYNDTPLQSRSDVLIITDLPSYIAKAETIIDQIDIRIDQIAIDVHFVETILNDDHELGIDWRTILEVDGGYKGKTKWELGGIGVDPADGGNSGGSVELGSLNAAKFQAVLNMMVENNKSKLLSQPSLTTLDDQPATITVGVSTWIEERSGSIGNGDLQITYRERQVPIELIVVPHIQHDDKILLELRPRVEEITGYQEGVGNFQLPVISTRTSDSRVAVKNGETAVIGGLITERKRQTDSKVWGLSSLPFIGHLFRHQLVEKERSDLSIFITPRIIRDGDEELGEAGKKSNLKSENEDPTDRPTMMPPPERSSKDEGKEEQMASASEPKAKPKPEPKVDPRLIVNLRDYFPLNKGSHWGYRWREKEGTIWKSALTVSGVDNAIALVQEEVPEGPRKSEGRTAYKWNDEGMLNLYRINGDSTVFDPPRLIIPAEMIKGRSYTNSYKWTRYRDSKGVANGEVIQEQRVIGKYSVSTGAGRFKDCIAVETVWYDGGDPDQEKTRKVVWYAPDFGPVKVEYDIPIDAAALQGDLSALLVKN